ncbi:MAG: patatin-like phospholipase family protein [Acholeplasmataceae bacterium]|nr:patatin-like phospholipase family protein [Acholeplasmataceae bacterium]
MPHVIGLALGGGGARGSYQIGVLKALDEAGILKRIHHVSGTSIGAINSLMVMAGLDYDRMVDIWKKIDNHEIYGTGPDRYKKDKLGLFSLQDLYDGLSKEITLSEIRESKIQGYVTAAKIKKDTLIEQVMIHRMKKKVFHLNNFDDPHRAVLASASIPVLFGSVDIEDDAYVDGGALDNCPIDPLIEHGCDIIIAVPIDGWFKASKYENHKGILINLETRKLFKMIPYDVLDFRPTVVTDKAQYGYMMASKMISILKEKKLLNADGTWHVPPGHTLITLTKEEEDAIREAWKRGR